MKSELPMERDIVLLGGGHAHLAVIKRFAMAPEPGVRLTVIARDVVAPYSGMLPGLVAGHYDHGEARIDLRPLCRLAGARLYHASATGLDLEARLVRCAERPPVPFDLLSIDIGASPSTDGIEGAQHAIPVKPVDRFLARWAEIEAEVLATTGPFRLVVIGAGAAGTELSLCLQYRLARALEAAGGDPARLQITVLSERPEPVPDHAPRVQRAMRRFLAGRGVSLAAGHRVVALEPGLARAAAGTSFAFDAAVLATHAAAQPWLARSGLAVDAEGFVRVDETLQSVSHEGVFAAGDIAAFDGRPLPKSGVYAVRQGPALAENLRRAARGQPLQPYRAQRRTLALISSGSPYAVASWGPLAFEGGWVWRLKDWIDRRWMRKYQELPKMAAATDPTGAGGAFEMRCGGCGAKVASPVLRRVLGRLRQGAHAEVVIGLEAPDDAAVIAPPAGKLLVQTVDHFRAFIDDPYLFGRITVNHCLGDIYAMGAVPRTALALVSLPYGPEAKVEADLEQLLAGAVVALAEAGVQLVGGHTGEAAELAFGLAINGEAAAEALLRKGGARPGDRLILTKPLGTGTVFAAEMRGLARAAWVEGAIATMLVSNGKAADCLAAHGAHAATDVTGFGLLGHLIEILNASQARARVDPALIPALDGALALIAAGITSSLQPANEAFSSALDGQEIDDAGRRGLLFDPQTAGGLLASLPATRADACLAALQREGYGEAAIIGEVVGEVVEPVSGAPLVEIRR